MSKMVHYSDVLLAEVMKGPPVADHTAQANRHDKPEAKIPAFDPNANVVYRITYVEINIVSGRNRPLEVVVLGADLRDALERATIYGQQDGSIEIEILDAQRITEITGHSRYLETLLERRQARLSRCCGK